MTTQEREERDRRTFRLASTHAFSESGATANVCRECGAHRDYHDPAFNAVDMIDRENARVRDAYASHRPVLDFSKPTTTTTEEQ